MDSKVSLLGQELQHRLASIRPLLLQALSCIGCNVQVQERFRAIAEGIAAPASFMHSPYISNSLKNCTEEQLNALTDL